MFLGREHPFPVLCEKKKIRVAAIECLRKALRVAPNYADAVFNLALLLGRRRLLAPLSFQRLPNGMGYAGAPILPEWELEPSFGRSVIKSGDVRNAHVPTVSRASAARSLCASCALLCAEFGAAGARRGRPPQPLKNLALPRRARARPPRHWVTGAAPRAAARV